MNRRRQLKAPFPYFGGKSRVAGEVWRRLGPVPNYIEPFLGGGAVLLLRPSAPRIETVNDLDPYVANFWRATDHDPEAVARHADGPVNEVDLHARHRWLVLSDDAAEFRRRMRTEPSYYDPRIAGWWCWGLCCWIGGGWCSTPQDVPARDAATPAPIGQNLAESERGPRLTQVCSSGGVHARGQDNRRPNLGGHARQAGRGVHGNEDAGTCAARRAWLIDWFNRLRDRLRTVRVCCGDWIRVCDSESVTTRLGITGVFFDPPYGAMAGRDPNLYATDSLTVAQDVRTYCLERGHDPKMRIALAGYAGEGHEALEKHGWTVFAWTAPASASSSAPSTPATPA